MADQSAGLYGEISNWPFKRKLEKIRTDAALHVRVGRYSIRVEDCSHFSFESYGGELGDPQIDADADSIEEMIRDGKLVSDALAQANVRLRFEIYDRNDDLTCYLHHDWPLEGGGS